MLDMDKRATYSYSAIQECIERVKTLKKTAKSRAEHSIRIFEIRDAYEFCLKKTNCILFEYEHSSSQDYIQAFDRKYSKKELDALLKCAILFLEREIREIYILMRHEEVNVIA